MDLCGQETHEIYPDSVPEPEPRGRRDEIGDAARDAHARFRRRRGFEIDKPQGELDDERTAVLIRAMVKAAKADGQLDRSEQDAIIGQLGDVTQDELDFLNREFDAPLDAREFAWPVPLGMEEQVYGFSLMGMDVDENSEVRHLEELAHGLRLTPEACRRIRQRFVKPAFRR